MLKISAAITFDLYGRVSVGTRVVVLPERPGREAAVRNRSILEAKSAIAETNSIRPSGLY